MSVHGKRTFHICSKSRDKLVTACYWRFLIGCWSSCI